jgi:DNA-binding LacI/PurR family transcriptional regulator
MGELAVKRLAEIIANPSASPVKIEIATSLQKRKSC